MNFEKIFIFEEKSRLAVNGEFGPCTENQCFFAQNHDFQTQETLIEAKLDIHAKLLGFKLHIVIESLIPLGYSAHQ